MAGYIDSNTSNPEAYSATLITPLGLIGVRCSSDDNVLLEIDFSLPSETPVLPSFSPLSREVVLQLNAYFADPRFEFDLPVAPQGTAYQQRVWSALQEIPSGESRQYGELAIELGSAPRAVGQACRNNPIPIVIPCHRVVAKTGLGGFAGETTGFLIGHKRLLLRHEGMLLD